MSEIVRERESERERVRESERESERERESVLVPSFCLTFRHFFTLPSPMPVTLEFILHRAGSQLKMLDLVLPPILTP